MAVLEQSTNAMHPPPAPEGLGTRASHEPVFIACAITTVFWMSVVSEVL